MPDAISQNAFTIEYDEIRLRAISKITISNEGSSVEVDAKWDTGASTSCISTKIAAILGLVPERKATVFQLIQSLKQAHIASISFCPMDTFVMMYWCSV